jgi:hypothetical protein
MNPIDPTKDVKQVKVQYIIQKVTENTIQI